MRRRRRASGGLDARTLAALRELLTPPAECEDDAARFVAAIMARIPGATGPQRAASGSAPARIPPRLSHQ